MIQIQKISRHCLTLCLAILLSSCASTETKLAVPYVVELRASPTVNTSMGSAPSPIKVTVFELKSTNAFELADFFALQKNAQQVLGDQMLAVNSVILRPKKTDFIKGMGNVQAKALGIVAAYRDINNSQWRLLIELPEAETTNFYKFWQFSPDYVRVVIDVDKSGISVNRNPKKK